MLISLLVTLAIVRVVINAETQKRATTSGSDAQANGALAVQHLRRTMMSAGYGFTQAPASLGCTMSAKYGGSPIAGFPALLGPVIITDGATGASDTIRVLSSAKLTYSVPIRLTNVYAPPQSEFKVAFTNSVEPPTSGSPGDLLLAVSDTSSTCELFHVTAVDELGGRILRVDESSGWNAPGHPAGSYRSGDVLVNMGSLSDVTFSIDNGSLMVRRLRLNGSGAPVYDPASVLQANIVNMQALYGKDLDGNGSIDEWSATLPSSNAAWMQILAVRIAVVSRSAQYEKDAVTLSNPQWNLGAGVPVNFSGAIDCDGGKCVDLRVDGPADWQHYRYKVFDTTIPLPNQIWRPV